MLEEKFDCRRIIELALNQEPEVVVEARGASHGEFVRHPITRPKMGLSDARIMEAPKDFHERVSIGLRLDLFPIH